MTEKELKQFSKKRDKLIASLLSSTQKQISENQKKTFERLLEKFVDKLQTDENGNVLNNDKNRTLLNEIDEVFKIYQRTEAKQTISLVLNSVLSIINFNKDYFEALDGKARTLKIIPKVKSFMKAWLGISGDAVEPNGFIEKLVSNDSAKIALKNTAMKIIIGQEGLESAKKEIKLLVEGNPDTLGAFEKHQRTFANDLFSQIDRATAKTIATDLGFVFAVYEGGIVERSREFCIEHAGKIYHIDEIKAFKPKKAIPVDYSPFTDLGGFNCLHHLNFISTALAKAMGKDVDNFIKK